MGNYHLDTSDTLSEGGFVGLKTLQPLCVIFLKHGVFTPGEGFIKVIHRLATFLTDGLCLRCIIQNLKERKKKRDREREREIERERDRERDRKRDRETEREKIQRFHK